MSSRLMVHHASLPNTSDPQLPLRGEEQEAAGHEAKGADDDEDDGDGVDVDHVGLAEGDVEVVDVGLEEAMAQASPLPTCS